MSLEFWFRICTVLQDKGGGAEVREDRKEELSRKDIGPIKTNHGLGVSRD